LAEVLELTEILISYRDEIVLDGVTGVFPRGIVTGIIGPNGAGKTTLLKGLCGGVDMSGGQISLDGKRVHPVEESWKYQVTLIPDDNALFPDLSVGEHFELIRVLFGIERGESAFRFDLLVEVFGLQSYVAHVAGELSFGFRKRLAIALSLYRGAEVFLFDEPYTGLDAGSLSIFNSVIRTIKQSGRIIIIASHIVSLLTDMCDVNLELRSGKLGAVGSSEESLASRVAGNPDQYHDSELDIPWLERTAT
jgi:ABC-type multidrug transport system ATPase subunit